MDNQNVEKPILLDFTTYIRNFFPDYIFDAENGKLIKELGMWAIRDEKFNNREDGWHIDRGILIVGVPGVGKDVIFRLLRKYLSYIGSSYGYTSRIVWEYAEKFKEQGYNCFNDVRGNCYFQELARTDEGSGLLTRESIQHFGNKILIGSDLINVRYNQFVDFAYQSHFSTNCAENELLSHYGIRCVDRLREMCNYMIFEGKSKRGKVPPKFQNNKNISTPPPARETTVDEHWINHNRLEAEYAGFIETGNVTAEAPINYHLLKSYGCAVVDDEGMRQLIEKAEADYVAPPRYLAKMSKEDHKKNYTWDQAKKAAVVNFYQMLKDHGAKTIFKIVDVPIGEMVNNIVSENKQQQ